MTQSTIERQEQSDRLERIERDLQNQNLEKIVKQRREREASLSDQSYSHHKDNSISPGGLIIICFIIVLFVSVYLNRTKQQRI